MTTPPQLQHAPTCSAQRLEQSSHKVREQALEVTTWRCLDCAAFSSESRPLTEAELLDADD